MKLVPPTKYEASFISTLFIKNIIHISIVVKVLNTIRPRTICLFVCLFHSTNTLEHAFIILKCMVNETWQNNVCFEN